MAIPPRAARLIQKYRKRHSAVGIFAKAHKAWKSAIATNRWPL